MEEPRYSAKYLLGDRSFAGRDSFTREEMDILEEDVANTKRFCEWLVMVPGFREEFENDPEGTVEKHGIHVNAREMFYLYDPEKAKSMFGEDAPYPDSVLNYQQFVRNKLYYRDELQKKGCVPADKTFAKWRERQINRCWGEFGGVNACIIHTPLAYELALGCSVGCEFCGLNAGKLQKLFRYTPENAELWREVLKVNHEIIGEGGADAPCYYATEPLDNPDYELLLQDFFEINGQVPQITTAAALRSVDRMKAMLDYMQQHKKNYYRFSVRSLDELYTFFREFAPRELLLVELLPQYPEAPSSCFVASGRAMGNETYVGADEYNSVTGESKDEVRENSQTISCISGVVVNMAERSIRLITPTNADGAHPTGEYILAKVFFTDGADYREKLEAIIRDNMRLPVEKVKPLRAYPYYSVEENEDGGSLKSRAGYEFRFDKEKNGSAFRHLCEMILEGKYTRQEIASVLYDEDKNDPLNTFWGINQLWKKGVIRDEYLK